MSTTSSFSFDSFEDHITEGFVLFHYGVTHNGEYELFTDKIIFEKPSIERTSELSPVVIKNFLTNLHILLGISYWKLFCPSHITFGSGVSISKFQSQYWNTLYTKGLGEFFYKNSIDYRGLVQFPYEENKPEIVSQKNSGDRALIMLGAGKDSILTAELLKKNQKQFSLFTLNPRSIHYKVAKMIGKPIVVMKREIDQKIFEYNKRSGVYNGHVPITSIFSWLGLFAAYLYDYRYVIASNEESANYGNVSYLGVEINHQWSKSFEHEKLLQEYIGTYISPDLKYFSLLRPFTELHITKLFTSFPQYFPIFSSCNKNFKIQGGKPVTTWCGVCPKCAFVFLLLAAFIPRETVISIFNKNLFEDESLFPLYKELLGVEGFKPFECVGTPDETYVAFNKILANREYKNDFIIKSMKPFMDSRKVDHSVVDTVFTLTPHHAIPISFREIIEQYENS